MIIRFGVSERLKEIGKQIGCAGVAAAAAVTLGLSVHHGLELWTGVLKPAAIAHQTAFLRQEECIYHAIRSQVPKGAAVYVNVPSYFRMERLAELSTLWAEPQAKIADARWRLSLVTVPAREHCDGIMLKVSRI